MSDAREAARALLELRRWQQRLDAAERPLAKLDLIAQLQSPAAAHLPAMARQTWLDQLEGGLAPWLAAAVATVHPIDAPLDTLWPAVLPPLWEARVPFPGRSDGQVPPPPTEEEQRAAQASVEPDFLSGRDPAEEPDDAAAFGATRSFTVVSYNGRWSGLPLLLVWPAEGVVRRVDGVGEPMSFRSDDGKRAILAAAAEQMRDLVARVAAVGDGLFLGAWCGDRQLRETMQQLEASMEAGWRPDPAWGLGEDDANILTAYIGHLIDAETAAHLRDSSRQAAEWVATLPAPAQAVVRAVEHRELQRIFITEGIARVLDLRRQVRLLGLAPEAASAWLAAGESEELEDVELIMDALEQAPLGTEIDDSFLEVVRQRQADQANLRVFLDTL